MAAADSSDDSMSISEGEIAEIDSLFADISDESEFEGFDLNDLIQNNEIRAEYEMDQAENDREFVKDAENLWMTNDSSPILAPFTGNSRLNQDLPANPAPIDFFNYLFNEGMWEIIVKETNNYAQSKLDLGNVTAHSRLTKWFPVCVDEVKVFFALIISMGLTRKPDLSDYWSTEPNLLTPFYGKHMSKDRFYAILSNLHLVDNRIQQEPGNVNHDRLFKVRPFVSMLNETFDKYSANRDLSLDEATCPFKGRVRFRVYNPAKPNKWGIKLYQVCESSSGYCLGFDIYDGTEGCAVLSEAVGVPHTAAKTTKLVVGLLAKVGALDKGHHIYLDNYYNSPELLDELDSMDTYACGTVRRNRKEVPEAFGKVKLKQGETIFRRRNNLLAVKYHDKRDVHMLTTIHTASMTVLDKVDRAGQPVVKPTAIVDYVRHMGGVDLSDQILQYYDVLRKNVKWWKKLFLHLFNLLVVNAYKLYLKFGSPPKKRSHQQFRSQLVIALIESAPNAPKPSGKRGRACEPVGRLIGNHYPEHIPAKTGAKRAHPMRDCIACNKKNRQGFRRKQSCYQCSTCQVTLCIPRCFQVYHTHKHFERVLQGDPTSDDSS